MGSQQGALTFGSSSQSLEWVLLVAFLVPTHLFLKQFSFLKAVYAVLLLTCHTMKTFVKVKEFLRNIAACPTFS